MFQEEEEQRRYHDLMELEEIRRRESRGQRMMLRGHFMLRLGFVLCMKRRRRSTHL